MVTAFTVGITGFGLLAVFIVIGAAPSVFMLYVSDDMFESKT